MDHLIRLAQGFLLTLILSGNLRAQGSPSGGQNEPEIFLIGPAETELVWEGVNGRTYFLQCSLDLESWHYLEVIIPGADEPIHFEVSCSGADEFYLRLRYLDFATTDPWLDDFDYDGYPNWDELIAGDDPLVFTPGGGGTGNPPIPPGNPPGNPPGGDGPKTYRVVLEKASVWTFYDDSLAGCCRSERHPGEIGAAAAATDLNQQWDEIESSSSQPYYEVMKNAFLELHDTGVEWANSYGRLSDQSEENRKNAASSFDLPLWSGEENTNHPQIVAHSPYMRHNLRLYFPDGAPPETTEISKTFIEVIEFLQYNEISGEYEKVYDTGEHIELNFEINGPGSTYSKTDKILDPSNEILEKAAYPAPDDPITTPIPLRIFLLPVEVKVTKEGEATAPEDGLVVKKSDTVRYRLLKGVPDNPVLLEDKIQWHWRILKWDGTYEDWKPFQDGKGHTFAVSPKDSGIYEIKATLDGQEFFFKRKKDDPHSAKKKDENDCFGVVDEQWQIDVRHEAKRNLASKAYAQGVRNSNVPAGPPGGYKCNLFVGHKASDGGATVPKINGRNPFSKYFPTANQWAGTEVKNIANWTLLGVQTYPQPGFVVARGRPGGIGHTGIVGYDGAWISAGTTEVNRKADVRTYKPSRFSKYTP